MSEKIEIECEACMATGVYSGMGESENTAVVCYKCKGTGCVIFKYEPFTARKLNSKIDRVYEQTGGIKVGSGGGYKPEDFGGMPYADWVAGKPFPEGHENRKFVCPKWWDQSKPRPAELDARCERGGLLAGGRFSDCALFPEKAECWKILDTASLKGDQG